MASENSLSRQMLVGGGALALFAFVATILVAVTFDQTKDQIAENEKQSLLRMLNAVLEPSSYDNELYADKTEILAKDVFKKPQLLTVYRARKQGQPVAAIIEVVTNEGYSGPIKLLVAVNTEQHIEGVRVVSHKETPGLGDGIERQRSDWIDGFTGKSLAFPPKRKWAVKKDGGSFDQLTGATITPRAVVKAVRDILLFYQKNQDLIYFLPAVKSSES